MGIESAKKDPNYVSTLMGVDLTTGLLPTKVYVDEVTHRLLVNAVISSTGAARGDQHTTITASTAETTVVTADAAKLLGVYGLVLTNTSASATSVTIRDGSGGTIRAVFDIPPVDTRGFIGAPDGAMQQAIVNNNWTAQCGTSVTSLEVTVMYTKT